MMQTSIKCPCCGNSVDKLSFLIKIEQFYFHVCDDCLNRNLTDEELIMMGYTQGGIDKLEQIKEQMDLIQ